ncbi:hypothetical protein LR48_Vigan02g253500 [Vigna angularis]|uniref:Uncharacterized protein n=1 Tax=Phaseolus angularis TaxID=3914 RepID=A0A0L9U0R5_PHAAN|nr:hypothetical protein LR48_Vigan02g253500 [Vigna angularis]
MVALKRAYADVILNTMKESAGRRFMECHGARVDGAEQWTLAAVCFVEMGILGRAESEEGETSPHDSDLLSRTTSVVTILDCGSRRLGSLRRRLVEEPESFSRARRKVKEGEIDATTDNGPGGDWCRRRRLGLSERSGTAAGPMEARLC